MESIDSALGLITVLVAGAAIAKLLLYYKSFGLPVIDYLEPSEILILFADNLLVVAPIILALVFPYHFIIEPSLIKENTFWGNVKTALLFDYRYYLCVIVGFGLIYLTTRRRRIHRFEIWSYLSLLIGVLYLVPLLYVLFRLSLTDKRIEPSYWISLPYGLSAVTLLGVALWNEVRKVMYCNYYSNTVVEFVSGVRIGNEQEFYIGKTKGFVFLYSKESNACTSYKMQDVKSITHGNT